MKDEIQLRVVWAGLRPTGNEGMNTIMSQAQKLKIFGPGARELGAVGETTTELFNSLEGLYPHLKAIKGWSE